MSLVMSREERDRFLLDHHTGVMVVIGGGHVYSAPVWYDYAPGGTIGFVLTEGSRRLDALDDTDAQVGLTVHDETDRAYAFVSVFGPVVVNRPVEGADLNRYWPVVAHALGGEDVAQRWLRLGADAYLRGGERGEIQQNRRIEVRPERWNSCDYRKAGPRFDEVLGSGA